MTTALFVHATAIECSDLDAVSCRRLDNRVDMTHVRRQGTDSPLLIDRDRYNRVPAQREDSLPSTPSLNIWVQCEM